MRKVDNEKVIESLINKKIYNQQIKNLISSYQFFLVEKGDMIININENHNYLYVLVTGFVKVYSIHSNGNNCFHGYLKSGMIFGEMELITKKPSSSYYQASSRCYLLRVPYTELSSQKLNYNPDLVNLLNYSLAVKLYESIESKKDYVYNSLEERLASLILKAKTSQGELDQLNMLTIHELANLLGTSTRHLFRVLEKWKSNNILSKEKGKLLVINDKKIEEIANLY
ncbi:Crp/Fnr family transcriptional regulator [Cytobacillus sp. Hm23]